MVGFLGNLEPALNTVPLVMGCKSMAGSVIGGIAETQELLDLCGGAWHHRGYLGDQDLGHQRSVQTDAEK
jgi:hypothetical protein